MIDLSKDKNYRKNFSGVELKDANGTVYKFKAVAQCNGFSGLIAEHHSTKEDSAAQRYVRLTDDLVFITPDLATEFARNYIAEQEASLPKVNQ